MFGKLREKTASMWESFKNTKAGKFVSGSKQKIADLFNQKPGEVKSDNETKKPKAKSTSPKDLGDIQREMDSKDQVVSNVSQLKAGDEIILHPHILSRMSNVAKKILKKGKQSVAQKFTIINIENGGEKVTLKGEDGKEVIWKNYKISDRISDSRIIKVGKKDKENHAEKKPAKNSPIENKETAPNDVETLGQTLKQNVNRLFELKDKNGLEGTLDLGEMNKIGENKYLARYIKAPYEVRIMNHNGYTQITVFKSDRYEYDIHLNDNIIVQKPNGLEVFNSTSEKDAKFIQKTLSILDFLNKDIESFISKMPGGKAGSSEETENVKEFRHDYLDL